MCGEQGGTLLVVTGFRKSTTLIPTGADTPKKMPSNDFRFGTLVSSYTMGGERNARVMVVPCLGTSVCSPFKTLDYLGVRAGGMRQLPAIVT
jgi:hypothetical protein